MNWKYAVLVLFIVIGVLPILVPLLRYVLLGWHAKRLDIMDGLNAQARLAYFQMFCRATPSTRTAQQAMVDFEKLYSRWYGRRFFFIPGMLFIVIATIAVALVILTTVRRLGFISPNPLFDIPPTAVAALAGAYLWVADDFISRARRLDFSPADVQWATLRFVIAVPMGYAFAAVAAKDLGPFIAFALGAFPLTALTAMLRRLAGKTLNLDATQEEKGDDVTQLQGVNPTIAARLASEDITTVTQLAYCDPIRLVMRSNLTFNFVTDCMSQALAWLYLKDQLALLRPMGMRGAVEIESLIDELDYEPAATPSAPDEQAAAQAKEAHDLAVASFPKMAEKLAQTPETLQITFRQIAEDPFTIFLAKVWS